MQIIWFGHSCFLLKTSCGKRILTDPFHRSIGYKSNFPKCDIITISHNHFDHSTINDINIDTEIIDSANIYNLDFVTIEGINSFHDNFYGLKRGPNIIYLFHCDNLCICHLGDLGHIPNSNILNKLSHIDILFIPIGGHFTIDGKEAAKLCNLLSPKIVIPMHYKSHQCNINLNNSISFLTNMNNIISIDSNIFNVDNINFPETKTVFFKNLI